MCKEVVEKLCKFESYAEQKRNTVIKLSGIKKTVQFLCKWHVVAVKVMGLYNS